MSKDACAANALVYDPFNASLRLGQVVVLEKLTPLVRAESGPVLDIGAGSGLNTVFVLERLPEARVYALEPSTAMKALVLTKVAAHPERFDWVTIRPGALGAAPPSDAISAAILLGVLDHFSPDERAALFAAFAAWLPESGAVLTDLQPPRRPARVESYETASVRIGDLAYSGLAEGWSLDDERMQWKMTCRTLDGDRVLAEETTEYLFRHPDPEVIRAGLCVTGLSLDQIEDTTFYPIAKD